MFQLRVSLVKDAKKQEQMWERQHEVAADKIYAMCSDLGGFFLKVLCLMNFLFSSIVGALLDLILGDEIGNLTWVFAPWLIVTVFVLDT